MTKLSLEMVVMRAKSRYPSDLGKGLFLGNFVNSTNLHQMKLLGIQKVIGLTPKVDENLEKSDLEYVHFEYEEKKKPSLDFNSIIEKIGEEGKVEEVGAEAKGTLIYCLSGNLSAAVAIQMMVNRGVMKEIAAAQTMNKRYETRNMQAWLFK